MGNNRTATQKKKLGVAEIACYGIGNCIGSGIFVSLCTGIGYTGQSIILAMIAANIIILLAHAYKVLMAGMFVLPGGAYSQAALLQPPLLVGVTAISSIFTGLAFAMYAMSIVEYASTVFPGIAAYSQLIAFVIVTLFFATTMLGSKFMGKFNLIMVAVMIVSIAVYILVGLPQVNYTSLVPGENYFLGGPSGFIMALAIMSFACQGATMPVALTPDTRDPKHTLPKAILIAAAAVMGIYCLIATVTAGVLPIETVANKNLGVVAREIFPYPVFVIFILGGACFAIATSLYGAIASIQHPLLATVQDGWLPAVLGKKTKGGYPWVMMLILYLIATVPIWIDMGLNELISLLMIPIMIINLINNALMFKLIKKYPDAWKTGFFRIPKWLFSVIIILSVFSDILISVALFTTLNPGDQYFIAIMLVLLFIYSYFRIKIGKVNLQDIERIRQEAEAAAYASAE